MKTQSYCVYIIKPDPPRPWPGHPVPWAVVKWMCLTVELDPDEVSQMIVRVLQEDAVASVRPEVEGDVSAGAGFERGEGHVGGLSDGDRVPNALWNSR